MNLSRRILENEAATATSEKWKLDSPILPKILERFEREERIIAIQQLCSEIEEFQLTSGSPMTSSPAPAASTPEHDVKNLDLITYPQDTGGYASTSEHGHLKQEDSPFQGNFTAAAATGIPPTLPFYDESEPELLAPPIFNHAGNLFADQSSYVQHANTDTLHISDPNASHGGRFLGIERYPSSSGEVPLCLRKRLLTCRTQGDLEANRDLESCDIT